MKQHASRLPVYEALHALNRDFEQVLAELARLHELGMFNRDLANILRIVVQETRAWANFELVEILQQREQDDWTRFGRLHRRWEKKLQDPNDVLIEAKLLMEKQRKAAGKKGKRKQPGTKSEDV
jgi:DNA-directed RNA polymerase specialized sigma54-like protein